MPDFLLEIGLEEVPARMIASAQAELLKRSLVLLTREQLISADATAHAYSTPRRLAVLIHDVLLQQPDITEETTGPAVKIAFKDGLPTPAAQAFARKAGIAVADLKTISTPKGDYLAATSLKKGRSAAEVIAGELPKEIAAIYWAKNMYWRAGKPERFVRPVLWLACLLGEEIVPVTFGGKTAGRSTYGHRVLSTGDPFDIQTPNSYLAQLEGEYVLADVEVRRHKIRKALDKVMREVPSARWREDHPLVDAVTHLTEWPDVLLGNFEPAYLELPEEVLVTVMRDHQKYFAVEDSNGKLAPHFLTVTNIALTAENAAIIRQGNERVLRARFNDARFFWEFDQRTPLADRVARLEHVTFQKDLGSYARKSERVRTLAAALATIATSRGATLDAGAIDAAATLAKTDLTTELVKEFTELQGIIGGLYARSEGLPATVADAIYDQYLPASAGDAIPRSAEGCILGLADRIDTIANMFALGMEPTGSKDPFALRRAANAIVKILAESSLPLLLSVVTTAAEQDFERLSRLEAFFMDRVDFYLRENRGQAYDVAKAVMAAGTYDLRDLVARSEAVTAVRGSEDFLAVCAGFKRMKNILAQAPDTEAQIRNGTYHGHNPIQLERMVLKALEVRRESAKFISNSNYVPVMQLLATLRPFVDDVFDNVKILNEDEGLRRFNLLKLLETVDCFKSIADFSEIVTAG
jgi:glycyl-tRNA synthetase beta chain